jgi:hypothetical protein
MRVDRYTFDSPAGAILERLATAPKEREAAGRARRIASIGARVGGVLAFAGFFYSRVLGIPPAIPVVIGILIAIPSLVIYVKTGDQDINDRKLTTARRLVALLRADISAAQPVSLMVDFRPYKDAAPPVASSGNRARYEQTWLELTTTLADGTAVTASLMDRISRKEKQKHRGTKVKEGVVTMATVSLRLDKRYGDAAAIASRLANTSPDAA